MKIVIFGASGRLGRQVAAQALARGHAVTAFARHQKEFADFSTDLTIAIGDIYKSDTVAEAIRDQDAVISVLGRSGAAAPMVCRDGMRAILPSMERLEVERLIAVSAFGAADTRNFGLYAKLLRLFNRKSMEDKDLMEALVKTSQTSWTIFRPAAFWDRSRKTGYRFASLLDGAWPTVRRSAVATAILDQIDKDDYYRRITAVVGK